MVALGEERGDSDPPSHHRDPKADDQVQAAAYRAQRERQAVAGDPGPEKGGLGFGETWFNTPIGSRCPRAELVWGVQTIDT